MLKMVKIINHNLATVPKKTYILKLNGDHFKT